MGIFGSSRKRSVESAAVITGAGSGIGAAFATELARRGGRVVCSDIDETAARTTADGIVSAGGEALTVRCDVAQLEDVIQLAEVSQDWFGGPPTLVVNNAGVGAGGTAIGETEIDDWNWVLGINLWGPIHGCHVFAPILREAGYGGIINVASAAAFAATGFSERVARTCLDTDSIAGHAQPDRLGTKRSLRRCRARGLSTHCNSQRLSRDMDVMTGPNSGPGHNSLLVYVEGQIHYAVRGITTILRDNVRYLDVREDVQRRYNRQIQKRLTKTT